VAQAWEAARPKRRAKIVFKPGQRLGFMKTMIPLCLKKHLFVGTQKAWQGPWVSIEV
jgi:hypothetical protein